MSGQHQVGQAELRERTRGREAMRRAGLPPHVGVGLQDTPHPRGSGEASPTLRANSRSPELWESWPPTRGVRRKRPFSEVVSFHRFHRKKSHADAKITWSLGGWRWGPSAFGLWRPKVTSLRHAPSTPEGLETQPCRDHDF